MVKAKEIEGLDCGAEAARGMGLVLATRLGEMCEHREAALGPEGEDGVHDMRVASRRLRSVLRDFRPYLRAGRRLEAARGELKRLAGVLGAVRDEDVAIRALEKLRGEAPEGVAEGLELFAVERRARREGGRAELARALEHESFESVRARVASAFEKATAPRRGKRRGGDAQDAGGVAEASGGRVAGHGIDAGDERGKGGLRHRAAQGVGRVSGGEVSDGREVSDGGPSFEELGRQIIERSWDELRSRGPDIYRPLKSRRLHKLRIASKRLRYALELFAACRGEALRELAHELARFQTALGELHDCDGWVEECGRYLGGRKRGDESRREDAGASASRREAAFWLLGHFSTKRAEHYVEALEIWRAWERDDFGSRLAESFEGSSQ
ncbi:MAG: CHAD domain-containing protein [Acidobacteriota bacterium]|nr:CHAD domain-containing protein [Acidobacteriota bacterium]MDQ5838882.1 CHAD domain-containing protein [Acidobacteriota bacterium]